jgi:tetratricopeptide (TPR) repeat protein
MTAKQFAEHPDLNLLAAFVEHTLTNEEREAVVAHVGECADCREQVALAVKVSGSESEQDARTKHSWWQALLVLFQIDEQWKLASLALAGTGLVAVSIFFVLYPRPSVERAYPVSGLTSAEKAVQHQLPILSVKPHLPIVRESSRYIDVGTALDQQGKYDEAIANYQKAIALKPDDPLAHWKLGEVDANQGRFSEAEAAIRTSLALTETSEALQSLGIILMYQGRDAEALSYLQRAFDLEMGNGSAAVDAMMRSSILMYLGIAHRRLNQALATADTLHRGLVVAANAAAENPENGKAWAFLGYFQGAIGDSQRAAMQITTALQLSPEDLTVRKTAVLAYEVLGQRDKTLALLKSSTAEEVAAINRWPDLADLHKDLRFVQLAASKQHNQAQLTDLNKAVKILQAPPPPPAATGSTTGTGEPPTIDAPTISATDLYANAQRDRSSGKLDLALNEFSDYLKWYGNTDLAANAQFYIAYIHYSQADYDDALREFDLVLEKYPSDNAKIPDALYYKGMTLTRLGRRTAGAEEFKELYKHFPNHDLARQACLQLQSMGLPCASPGADDSKSGVRRKG